MGHEETKVSTEKILRDRSSQDLCRRPQTTASDLNCVVTESKHYAEIFNQKQCMQHYLTALTQVSNVLYEAICSRKMWTMISSAREQPQSLEVQKGCPETGTEELFKAMGRQAGGDNVGSFPAQS